MAQGTDDAEKGRNFQAEVRRFVEGIIGENPYVEILSEQKVQGASHSYWKVDILVKGKLLLTNEFSTYLAIISCKHVKEGANPATFWTEMGRAYMELNDLKLVSELGSSKFFLVVDRHSGKGETDKNYPLLFKNIGVEMINFNDSTECENFATQLIHQSSEVNPLEQTKNLEKIFKEFSEDRTA